MDCVSYDEASKFADSIDALSYLECSVFDEEVILDNLRTKIFNTAKEY